MKTMNTEMTKRQYKICMMLNAITAAGCAFCGTLNFMDGWTVGGTAMMCLAVCAVALGIDNYIKLNQNK